MAYAQKPDFVFRRKGRVHFNGQGPQFSRLLAAEVCASVVVMLDTPCSEVVWRVLATNSIRQFPLYFPSCTSPCAFTFQLESTNCCIRTVLPPDGGPRYARNMQRLEKYTKNKLCIKLVSLYTLKADLHIACRAHTVPLPCRAAKGLECVFPTWFTQCSRVWFTLAMPRPCHALTMPFFSRPRHSTDVERRPVGYLPAFGFFRQPRGVPRRLLSEAYQSSSKRSIPTTVKSGSSTLQKRRSVKLLD
jgi:hypothetical protein